MPRSVAAKLTSEERCRKAFRTQMGWEPPREGEYLDGPDSPPQYFAMAGSWKGWEACWKYLESRVTEFIEQ